MTDFVGTLVDMGFPKEKAEKAVEATGGLGVQPAMDWILNQPVEDSSSSHNSNNTNRLVLSSQSIPPGQEKGQEKEPEKMDTDDSGGGTSSGNGTVEEKKDASDSDVNEQGVVRSYKCDDCGRILKNVAELEYHAAKTNHSKFSESTEEKKPLTEEERAAQLLIIQEKLKLKKVEREENEKKDALDREKLRMKSGKELQECKRRLEEQEMKEIMETRRREKADDARARAKVKAQIEADKIARKAKFGGGTPAEIPTTTPSVASIPSSTTTSEPAPKKDYKETKIQLRLPDGKALTQTFGANEPLAAVRLYVQLHRTDGQTGEVKLMTSFPKKVFEGDDYDMPLDALGLVPSAVLIVTRSTPTQLPSVINLT